MLAVATMNANLIISDESRYGTKRTTDHDSSGETATIAILPYIPAGSTVSVRTSGYSGYGGAAPFMAAVVYYDA